MNKIKLALGSRTFWTVVLTVVVNTVNANAPFIPPQVLEVVNVVLGLVATYFHINPSQNYKA